MKLFLPILFLILAGGIFFWYINPTYTAIGDLRAQEAQYDQALSKATELQTVRDQLVARYNTFSPTDLDRLQKLLPDHIDNVRLILDLDNMASHYGMRVRNVTIDTTGTSAQVPQAVASSAQQLGPGSQAYESVVISFNVSGTYDVFRQYLTDLEQSLRLSDVIGISFVPNDTGVFTYSVHLRTYWLKP